MLILLSLILLGVLFFRFAGRVAVGLLILLPVIIIGLLLLKLAIIALPALIVIGIVYLLLRGARHSGSGTV